ncbi:paraquat-inducible protein A [Labrys neptuniae]
MVTGRAKTATAPPLRSMAQVMECHDCGQLHEVPPLQDGMRARCSRCGSTLEHYRAISLSHAYAYTWAGAICFAMANFLPFIKLEISGRAQVASLVTGIKALYDQGLWELAGVVAITMLVAPGLQILARLIVLGGLRLRRPPRWLPLLYRGSTVVGRWAMIEVYMLGLLVAYVKLIDLARVDLGPAVFAVVGLMLVTVATGSLLDDETIWANFARKGVAPSPPEVDPKRPTALCEACGLVSNLPESNHGHGAACPRCSAPLHQRKPNSITKTWALVLTATILYIPANLFPIMTVISLGRGQPDTIISGVIELADAGMWPLAVLVFFASILVPVLKLLGLTTLLITTQRGTLWRLQDRTVLYRIIEFVGRWSMIDIFMISILVALVQLGEIATIEPGIGAIAFASVVIITMIASESFDPRLMWDALERRTGKKGP